MDCIFWLIKKIKYNEIKKEKERERESASEKKMNSCYKVLNGTSKPIVKIEADSKRQYFICFNERGSSPERESKESVIESNYVSQIRRSE